MGVFSTNLAEIASGGLISSSHTSDVYNVLSGNTAEDIIISGSFTMLSGSAVLLDVTASNANITTLNTTTATVSTATITSASINNISNTIVIESASISHNTTNITVEGSASVNYLNVGNTSLSSTTLTTTSGSLTYINVSDKFISEGTVFIYTASLPTTDPAVNGQLWRSGSYLMISVG